MKSVYHSFPPLFLLFCFPIPTIYYYLLFPTILSIYSFPPSWQSFRIYKKECVTLQKLHDIRKTIFTKFSLVGHANPGPEGSVANWGKRLPVSPFLFLSTSVQFVSWDPEEAEERCRAENKQIPVTSVVGMIREGLWKGAGEILRKNH